MDELAEDKKTFLGWVKNGGLFLGSVRGSLLGLIGSTLLCVLVYLMWKRLRNRSFTFILQLLFGTPFFFVAVLPFVIIGLGYLMYHKARPLSSEPFDDSSDAAG